MVVRPLSLPMRPSIPLIKTRDKKEMASTGRTLTLKDCNAFTDRLAQRTGDRPTNARSPVNPGDAKLRGEADGHQAIALPVFRSSHWRPLGTHSLSGSRRSVMGLLGSRKVPESYR